MSESKTKSWEGLTSWGASEDIFSDFIIDEDEEGVGNGTEPPHWPKDGQTKIQFQMTKKKPTQKLASQHLGNSYVRFCKST